MSSSRARPPAAPTSTPRARGRWRPRRTSPHHRPSSTLPVVTGLTPTCVWRISPQLVAALDERFGEPVDAYVNGSQTWLRDDGPAGVAVEGRGPPVGPERKAAAL